MPVRPGANGLCIFTWTCVALCIEYIGLLGDRGLIRETCDWRVVPSGGGVEAGDWELEA